MFCLQKVSSRCLFIVLVFAAAFICEKASAREEASVSEAWKTSIVEADHYLSTKQLDKAESSYRQALKELGSSKYLPGDELAFTLEKLGNVLYMRELYEDALPLFKKALRVSENRFGKESLKTVPYLKGIGAVYENEGDFRRAESFYSQALAICKKDAGAPLLTAEFEQRVGRVQRKRELFSEAGESYFRSLTVLMQQESLPDTDLLQDLLADYNDLLLSTVSSGKLLKSHFQEELLKDKLSSLKKKQGAEPSQFTADVYVKLADRALSGTPVEGSSQANKQSVPSSNPNLPRIHPERKFSDFAALENINKQRVTFYERLIATDIDTLGPEHPSVARDLCGLASIHIAAKNYAAARSLLSRAAEIYAKVYKEDSAPVRQTKLLLELIAEEANSDRPSLDRSCLDNLPRIPIEAGKIELALGLNDLAFMHYCQGKIERALKVYAWALAGTLNCTGQDSILAAGCMVDMSKLLRLSGRSREADSLEENARAIARINLLEKRSQVLP